MNQGSQRIYRELPKNKASYETLYWRKFPLSETSYLKVGLPVEPEQLLLGDPIVIEATINQTTYTIYDFDTALPGIESLLTAFMECQAMKRERSLGLQRHMSRRQWHMWALEKNDNPPLETNFSFDVEDYLIWGCHLQPVDTWLYTLNLEVVLEITPSYQWDPKKAKKNDTGTKEWEKFIKNYQPSPPIKLYTKEIAALWEGMLALLKTMEENDLKVSPPRSDNASFFHGHTDSWWDTCHKTRQALVEAGNTTWKGDPVSSDKLP